MPLPCPPPGMPPRPELAWPMAGMPPEPGGEKWIVQLWLHREPYKPSLPEGTDADAAQQAWEGQAAAAAA